MQPREDNTVRPRRKIRPPIRLEDYETGYVTRGGLYPSHSSPTQPRMRYTEETYSTEGAAKMTPLTSTFGQSSEHQVQWDTTFDEWVSSPEEAIHSLSRLDPGPHDYQCYRDSPKTQLDHLTPSVWYREPARPSLQYSSELEEIRRENIKLRQSQQALHVQLTELREFREEMKQLLGPVHHNEIPYKPMPTYTRTPEAGAETGPSILPQRRPGPPKRQPPPPPLPAEELEGESDDEWPDPPPWPGTEEATEVASVTEPIVHMLEKLMTDLQGIKAQTTINAQQRTLTQTTKRPPPITNPPCPPSGGQSVGIAHVNEGGIKTESWSSVPNRIGHTSHYTQSAPLQEQANDDMATKVKWSAPSPMHQPSYSSFVITEPSYRGPRPSIPYFSRRDPSDFARLKLALTNLLPSDGTELFKYQILVDHLKLEEARLVADSYLNSTTPYSDTMAALNEKFGQPHQIALNRIASVMESPDIRRGDTASFEKFALQVRSLVGMLKTLGPDGEAELKCGSHVARLLSKLPSEQRADFRRAMFRNPSAIYTLLDFSDWLQYEAWCHEYDGNFLNPGTKDKLGHQKRRVTTILHGSNNQSPVAGPVPLSKKQSKAKPYCPYCESTEHYLSQCSAIQELSKDQLSQWIRTHNKCWRCARSHQAAHCDLRKLCGLCHGKHLQVLHEVNNREGKGNIKEESCLVSTTTEVLYLDRPPDCHRVLLKVVCVTLHYRNKSLDTYALLDDGSERTMLLSVAAKKLGLGGEPETLDLRTIRQDIQTLNGASVSFDISPVWDKKSRLAIKGAFTADRLGLAEHTYPVTSLQKQYKHLDGLPLQSFEKARPLLLIGTDHPHLITPIEPVRLGHHGGPAAVRTRLGWTLQGPMKTLDRGLQPQQCLFTVCAPQEVELLRNVEKLWQVDVLPYRNEKMVTRSRQDNEAIELLDQKTTRVEVEGVLRYATPLLRKGDMPLLQAYQESVMPNLRSTEKRLSKNPKDALAYCGEIQKLIDAGAVAKLDPSAITQKGESWFIPHHMVCHNNKNRIVFNCSHLYRGISLNNFLLPGPTLGPSLLGVLLRFREHATAISGDIKGMFHQVRLLPEDRSLLRFVWRDMRRDQPPEVYEWQVLPFGTTCSPCCATYALQRHVTDHTSPGEDVRFSVEQCFYVDNCLQSAPTPEEAKTLVDKLRSLLSLGGFDLCQWASNDPSVINHLPKDAKSANSELWLRQNTSDTAENTLGLSWNTLKDTLGYKHRPFDYGLLTMRNIYKVLASQYDPLGYIIPYTTRAKVLLRRLWEKQRDWDDPLLPQDLKQLWKEWEDELQTLSQVILLRPYTPAGTDLLSSTRQVHIFCDASEQAYGSVSYLRTVDSQGKVHLSFLLARSRVAPRRQLSMPRLELCAAVTGAQLAKLLKTELTLEIDSTILWTDSTTVLTWLQSESCRYKVFVGTRVAEVQELTEPQSWRYVDSSRNPADDITRGKSLKELAEPNRFCQGPPFLLQDPSSWPVMPVINTQEETSELRKSFLCCTASVLTEVPTSNDVSYKSWKELIEHMAENHYKVPGTRDGPTAEDYRKAERQILNKIQKDSFPAELKLLKAGKPVSSASRLSGLSPELDEAGELIRVGGRLRRATQLETSMLHPIVLDPNHAFTKLLIGDYDKRLCHPGPERLFADIRRTFWVLRGREAIRRYQYNCPDCRRWKAKPVVPKMADLPDARLRLFKPPFYSTGADCFGPFQVRIGRRMEKRWGIIFKCLTTRAVHLDILTHIDVDSYLMALRRFIARRGTPAEIISDQGTNFRGAERELQKATAELSPDLKQEIAIVNRCCRFLEITRVKICRINL